MRRLFEKYKRIPAPIKASLWFLVCSFFQSGISTITTPIFTRLLSTAEYGNYSVFASWQSIVTVFVGLNIYSAVYTQGLVKYEDEKNTYAASMQGLLLTLCSIWLIIYLLFHNFWNSLFSLTTVQMLSMIAMIWTSSMFNLWAAEQRVAYKYRGLVIVTVLVSIMKPVVGILLVLASQDKVTARIVGLLVVELVCFTWIFFYEIRKGKTFYSKKFWKYTLVLTIPLVPHYLSQTVLSSADRIMIRDMIGSSEAGIYSLAYSIAQIMTLFSAAMIQTLNPWIFRKIKDKKIKEIAPVAYTSLIFIALLNIILIAFAPEIVRIFASQSYYSAIWVMPPVAMSVYFMFAYSLFASFEFYFEKTKYIAVATILSAALNVGLNYIFIKLFGYRAAGYTTLLCYFFYTAFHYICMTRIVKKNFEKEKPYSIKRLGLITSSFLLIGFIFLASYGISIVRYAFIAMLILLSVVKRKWIIQNVLLLKDIKTAKK